MRQNTIPATMEFTIKSLEVNCLLATVIKFAVRAYDKEI